MVLGATIVLDWPGAREIGVCISVGGRLNLQPNDVIFQAAPLTFDPSIVDIFLAFSSGAALLVVSNEVKLSHTRLSESLFPCMASPYLGVTVMQVTPSFLSRWPIETLQNIMFGPKSTLRALILGGEPPPHWDILVEWKGGNVDCKLFNIYGITEVSCWASLHEVNLCHDKYFVNKYRLESVNPIPLGTALSGTLLSVRDTLGVEVQEGEGEMFIGTMDRVCLINEELMGNLELPLYRATGDIVKVPKTGKEKKGIICADPIWKQAEFRALRTQANTTHEAWQQE
uniref:AMP-dependent synthetase/ligase domain-containing protein n=1 Tax=Timema cristinae TaxID=61476 RepID=A0A7R9GTY9_TIMCR|nr:unnamed protein product [Timema cristinae]